MSIKLKDIHYRGFPNELNNDNIIAIYENRVSFQSFLIGGIIQDLGTLAKGSKIYKLGKTGHEYYNKTKDLRITYQKSLKIIGINHKGSKWNPLAKNYYANINSGRIKIIYIEKLSKATNGILLTGKVDGNKLVGKIYRGRVSYFTPLKLHGDLTEYISVETGYKDNDPRITTLVEYFHLIVTERTVPKIENSDKSELISDFLNNYQKDIKPSLIRLSFSNSNCYIIKNGLAGICTPFTTMCFYYVLRDETYASRTVDGIPNTLFVLHLQNIIVFINTDLEVSKLVMIEGDRVLFYPYNDRYFKKQNMAKFIEIKEIINGIANLKVITPMFTSYADVNAEELYRSIINDKKVVTGIKVKILPLPPNTRSPVMITTYSGKRLSSSTEESPNPKKQKD